MNLQFLPRPRVEVLVKVAGCIGEGGENKDFPVGFAVAVRCGLADLGFDERFKVRELSIAYGRDGLGFLEQKLKLRAVISDRLEPFWQFEMGEMNASAATDGEVLLVEIGVLQLVRGQRFIVEVWIIIEVLLKSGDTFFQLNNLVDSALERQAKGVHGAFEALQEVDLHHGDEDALAAFLGESAEDLVFIGGPDLHRDIVPEERGGMV